MKRHLPLLAATPLFALPLAAQAQTRAGADVAVTGGYSNNPFVQGGSSTGAGSVSIDVAPYIERVRERSTFSVRLAAHVEEYFTRYPTNERYSGTFAYNGRPSETVSTFARIDLSSGIVGTFNDFLTGDGFNLGDVAGSTTGASPSAGDGSTGAGGSTGAAGSTGSVGSPVGIGPINVPTNDIGLLGSRDRRRSLYATGGLSARVSAHDSLSVSAYGDFARYRNFGAFSDYDGFGGNVGYSRQLSSRASIGLQGAVARYQYQGPQGDTNVYTVQATGSNRLSEYWTI